MIKNVVEGIWRGDQDGVWKILGYAINSVLKLNSEQMMEEYRFCEENNIEFIDIEMSEFKKPSQKKLDNIIKIIDSNYMKKVRPLFIHCKHGHERTGIVVANYRMKVQGWSKFRAVREALKEGFSPFYLWWFL